MPSLGRRLVAEAVGTFGLVFVGAAVVVVNGGFPTSGIGLLGIALAHAVVLSVMILFQSFEEKRRADRVASLLGACYCGLGGRAFAVATK